MDANGSHHVESQIERVKILRISQKVRCQPYKLFGFCVSFLKCDSSKNLLLVKCTPYIGKLAIAGI